MKYNLMYRTLQRYRDGFVATGMAERHFHFYSLKRGQWKTRFLTSELATMSVNVAAYSYSQLYSPVQRKLE